MYNISICPYVLYRHLSILDPDEDISTVPTSVKKDKSHAGKMRLDYILANQVTSIKVSARVCKNNYGGSSGWPGGISCDGRAQVVV